MIVGMIIFPDITHLDFTGPHEVFSKVPSADIRVIAHSLEPVRSNSGLKIVPDTAFHDCPQLDIIFVPGGSGADIAMEDRNILEFLRRQAKEAKFVTSVCTGALVLGAAGLLKGYRATTHWMSLDLLSLFGATPLSDRVVVDGNRITGGGVTAGIDFALVMVRDLFGPGAAQMIQLIMEYNPSPPFHSGHPSVADPGLVEKVVSARAASQKARLETSRRAAKLYCGET